MTKCINQYLEQGLIEQLNHESSENPIHLFTASCCHQRVTTKLRVVFDASAHEGGNFLLIDLNSLKTGPNLNPELLSILIKFRKHVAFM